MSWKTLICLALIAFPAALCATNYYVSASATGTQDGTLSHPYANIQNAADRTNPGDTVFVRSGTYTNGSYYTAVEITRSGSAGNWIVYKAYPGEAPKIKFNDWLGICVDGAAYIEINGFTVEGYADSLDSATAWSLRESTGTGYNNGVGIGTQSHAHHVRIVNNTVYKCCGGGIGINQSDYITIENNITHHNAFWSPYACSGISVYQAWNSDAVTGYKIIIRGNVSYANYNYIPFFVEGYITDGNGIIIDDSRNTMLGSTGEVYQGRTLIENNISFNNGGRGICLFSSDHIDAVNNTLYKNDRHPEIQSGELTLNQVSDIKAFNNIMVCASGIRPIHAAGTSSNDQCDYNLSFGGAASNRPGAHDVINEDPLFTAIGEPSDAAGFQIKTGSPAINAASPSFYASMDFTGVSRPQGTNPDIGAYEYIGGAPVERVQRIGHGSDASRIKVYTVTGKLVKAMTLNSSTPDMIQSWCSHAQRGLPAGIYIYQITSNGRPTVFKKAWLGS